MTKPFRPQLLPNKQIDPEDMEYPLIASYKLDGIRCLFINGEMRTRSGKLIQNKALQKKYEWIKTKSKTLGVIFDGELYSHEREFNEISGLVRTIDGEAPDDLKFYCFDCLDMELPNMPFRMRSDLMVQYLADEHPSVEVIEQYMVKNDGDARECMRWALKEGYEGLILLSPDSQYKQGRITIPSGDGYKLKPYETFDSRIIGVVQATEVDPNAEKTTNELGYSETSKKQDDRIPVEKAAAFEVLWHTDMEYTTHKDELTGQECEVGVSDGYVVKVVLAMTDKEKEEVWKNREDYPGKFVEWKGMTVGMKDVPRHPVFKRFRPDKDE